MRISVFGLCMTAVSLAAVLALTPAGSAQNGAPAASPANATGAAPAAKKWCSGCSVDGKTTPRTRDGHPDFSGFYNWGVDHYVGDAISQTGGNIVSRTENGSIFLLYGGLGGGEDAAAGGGAPRADITCATCDNPPYKPEYMKQVQAIADTQFGNASPLDPQYDCKPLGIPRGALRGSNDPAMQIVQNADVVAFLYEDRPGPYFRIVYIDGRPHPDNLDESFYGHSIGHWEGDTLVVDVVGLNDETWLGSGTIGPRLAMMHSNKEHVIERWTRNGDTLTYQATVEDPVMFTKPWVMNPRTTQIAPGDYISPTMCVPFDKGHLVKKDGSKYETSTRPANESAATVTAAIAAANGTSRVAGTWNVTIHSVVDGLLNEQWSFQQDGDKVTGTVKNKNKEMPLAGTLTGTVLNATITDGAMKYQVVGTVEDENDIDGTIRMDKHVYLLSAKRAQ